MKTYSSLKEYFEDIQNIFNQKAPYTCLVISNGLEVATGVNNDYNEKYCKDNNIPVYKIGYGGGTIVMAKGNIGICRITNVKDGWVDDDFWFCFINYLKDKYNIDAVYKNNDLLIDGCKVASQGEIRIGDNLEKIYTTYQISINQDIEAIKNICTKQMVKTPKALSDYGVSLNEVLTFCENYFDN